MVVDLIQYPDKIRITRSGESVRDENGDWQSAPDEVFEYYCRFVPNGGGKQIKLADGSDYTYSYRIAFPYGATNILVHDNYERLDTLYKGVIQQFEVGQLHSVAWV